MDQQIKIELHQITGLEAKRVLEEQPLWADSEIKLELQREKPRYRGSPDPTILVAIVSVAGSAIGALISGLLQVAQQKTTKKIVLRSKSGASLEIPADTKPEEIDKLLQKLNQMDLEKIILP